MKVAFCNPPWFEWEEKSGRYRMGVRAGSRWGHTFYATSQPDRYAFGDYRPYPIFMGYAASYAAKHTGAKVIFRDSVALSESVASFIAWLSAEKPEFIFIESGTPSWPSDIGIIALIHQTLPDAKLVITGTIVTSRAAECLHLPGVVACIQGEYEKGSVRVINGQRGIVLRDLLTTEEMNAAPFPYYDKDIAHRYCDHNPLGQRFPHAQVWSSRGCFAKCLSGDTPVNTVYGLIPIKELVGQHGVGVFTYDPNKKEAKVCTARNIRKYGDGDLLVRVRFDDGTHVDCTPDHKFLAFKWGNQFKGETEWSVEAKDLRPGMHLRAIKQQKCGSYISCMWTRYGRAMVHRLVAEWKLGRKLTDSEQVHHRDRNKLNWNPDNLEVYADAKAHFAAHPEVSERMKTDNPVKNMTQEWAAKLKAAREAKRGIPLAEETKQKMKAAAQHREDAKTPEQKRENALKGAATKRAKNLFYRGGVRAENGRFVADNGVVNHRVVSVETLDGRHDTYCLEIPETGWFYANNVLVKNCSHCEWPASMTGDDPDGTGKRTVRQYSAAYLESFLTHLIGQYGFRSIYFDDDTMNLGNRHVAKVCAVMRKLRMPWSAMCRIDTIDREHWRLMRESGCFGVKIGYESGNQYVVDQIIRKGLDLKEARETTIYLKSLGFTVHGTFMSGVPGETKAQMQQTLDYIKSLPLDSLQHSGMAELEGAPVHVRRERGEMQDANYTRENDGVKAIEKLLVRMRSE